MQPLSKRQAHNLASGRCSDASALSTSSRCSNASAPSYQGQVLKGDERPDEGRATIDAEVTLQLGMSTQHTEGT
jgi:hypothetical protein